MSQAVIRPAARDDLPSLVQLCAEHALYEGAEFQNLENSSRLERAIFAAPPVLYAWVVTLPGTLVGYMTATLDFSTWGADFYVHLDCLYMQEPLRGQGVGLQLLRQLQQFARERGCRLIQWQTPADNTPGIRFYERIGARSLDKKRYFLECPP